MKAVLLAGGNGLCRGATMGSNALPLPFDVGYKYERTGGCGYYCIDIFSFFFLKCFSNTDGRGTPSTKRFSALCFKVAINETTQRERD